MVLDPSIITNGVTQGLAIQQRNIEQMQNLGGALGQLVLGQKANKMRQMQTPEEQQAYANKSLFSPYLNQILKADQTAAAKAAADKLKADADLNKIYAETKKLGSESGEIDAKTGKLTTETGITKQNNTGTIWSAYLTGGPLAAKAQLENMKNNGVISPESYQTELTALTDLQGKDAKAQQEYAFGRFKGLQDPKYLLTTADNVLDNQTSVDNNVRDNNTSAANSERSYKASVYGTDKQFQSDQQKLEFEKSQISYQYQQQEEALKSGKAKLVTIGGKTYVDYGGGKGLPYMNAKGEEVSASSQKSMSPTTQKELFETEDVISSNRAAITNLREALALSAKSYQGVGASGMASVAGNLPDWTGVNKEQASNTRLLDNIINAGALDALKATFGGAPTEGERKILIEIQGSVNLPKEQREAIWNRAIAAAERRLAMNMQKAEGLRSGSFFQSQQLPQTQVPSRSAGSGATGGRTAPLGTHLQ